MVALGATKQSKLDRLMRSAQRATMSNVVTNLPWLVPAAYANSTSLTPGTVVSNGGYWYMMGSINGAAQATNGSGAGPTTTNSAAWVQDGTSSAYFAFLGKARMQSNDPDAPTVSLGASPGLAQQFTPPQYANNLKVFGATATVRNTYQWQLFSFNSAAATPACVGASVGWWSDAPRLSVLLPSNGQQFRVSVDDRYLYPGSYMPSGDQHLDINWGTGAKKVRRYKLETNKSVSYMGAIQVGTRDQIWADHDQSGIRMVYITDSWGQGSGYGPFLAGNSIPSLVGKYLGIDDVWNMSIGGTGDLATNGGANYSFGQRVADVGNAATIASADIIVMQGSTNDTSSLPADITAARLATLQAIRTLAPTALIIVIGVPSLNASCVTVENAVKSAFDAWADAHSIFVRVATASVPPLIFSYNVASTPGAAAGTTGGGGNNAYYMGDSGHMTDPGMTFFAWWITSDILRQVELMG